MNFDTNIIKAFMQHETPFYYYDTDLLKQTLQTAQQAALQIPNSLVHFAIKSNANLSVLQYVRDTGFGADCVSGGEIQLCLKAGIPADKIMYAGVGKTDKEISFAIENGILCFNVESLEELDIINQLAGQKGRTVNVALRINPNVDAHTHEYITTGLEENKFGIALDDMLKAVRRAEKLPNVNYYGLHFHIGSQILNFNSFRVLSNRINKIQDTLEAAGIQTKSINVGGGLGVDYDKPQENPIPDFQKYFAVFKKHLRLRPGQAFHCELGRALSAQWGALITRTIFVKKTSTKRFAIVDAGFTELIRPALYQAHHKIINLTASDKRRHRYDVVGPICESSDTFGTDELLPAVERGHLLAILSAGAYGEVMASQYNCRPLVKAYCTEDFIK